MILLRNKVLMIKYQGQILLGFKDLQWHKAASQKSSWVAITKY